MFCLDIMRGGANGLKSMLMICAILVFIGPIMIIVGIAMLGEPNNRSARVASYNAGLNAYASHDCRRNRLRGSRRFACSASRG